MRIVSDDVGLFIRVDLLYLIHNHDIGDVCVSGLCNFILVLSHHLIIGSNRCHKREFPQLR